MQSGNARTDLGNSFQEAIAHWALDLQTQLKKTSSLPTAMFDACDPMLEARLCEATEGMFQRLLELGPSRADEGLLDAELSLEAVTTSEIAGFLDFLAALPAAAPPDLMRDRAEEFHGILVDAMVQQVGAASFRAESLLRLAYGDAGGQLDELLRGGPPPDAAAPELRALLRLVLGDDWTTADEEVEP